ncbi:DUF4365 domain-containing protein, partial [Priestia megaterium]
LGIEYINLHRSRWDSYPGPVILVYVDPKSGTGKTDQAWWTDLKNPASYTVKAKSYIIVPKDQKFDISAKKNIHLLTGHRHQESKLPNIETGNDLLSHISLNEKSIKRSAKEYYDKLRDDKVALLPA